MGSFSIWHWLVVGILVLLLFGKGRFSSMMGDVAKGVKQFKRGMAEEDEDGSASRRTSARLKAQPPLEPDRERELKPMSEDRPQG